MRKLLDILYYSYVIGAGLLLEFNLDDFENKKNLMNEIKIKNFIKENDI